MVLNAWPCGLRRSRLRAFPAPAWQATLRTLAASPRPPRLVHCVVRVARMRRYLIGCCWLRPGDRRVRRGFSACPALRNFFMELARFDEEASHERVRARDLRVAVGLASTLGPKEAEAKRSRCLHFSPVWRRAEGSTIASRRSTRRRRCRWHRRPLLMPTTSLQGRPQEVRCRPDWSLARRALHL